MSEPMRDEVELPALDITEEEKRLAKMIMSDIARPFVERLQCRERQLKAALSANREKDAEIERLKEATLVHNDSAVEAWKLTQKWQKRVFDLEAELSSLRASGGEKPEDAWEEGFSAGISAYASAPGAPSFSEMWSMIRRFQTKPDNPYVAPPTLTREKE